MKAVFAVIVALWCSMSLVSGHGYFVTPLSRPRLAELSGDEPDPTTIIAEPIPDIASGRNYPGARPFAEPGVGVSKIGPCGSKAYGSKTNWNKPDKSWGKVVQTFKAGEVIDVEWCVDTEADHGGLYSYRICTDDRIVARFIDSSYTPNETDWHEMEACFQRGILSCTDVPGQNCPVNPDCQPGWGCEKATSWFTCGPKDNGRCSVKGVADCQAHGHRGRLLRDKVRLPMHTSNHTLLGFRWDCMDTAQLWLNCADIAIV
eukprot:Colp12_sorted_trinity150504_noHs@29261